MLKTLDLSDNNYKNIKIQKYLTCSSTRSKIWFKYHNPRRCIKRLFFLGETITRLKNCYQRIIKNHMTEKHKQTNNTFVKKRNQHLSHKNNHKPIKVIEALDKNWPPETNAVVGNSILLGILRKDDRSLAKMSKYILKTLLRAHSFVTKNKKNLSMVERKSIRC